MAANALRAPGPPFLVAVDGPCDQAHAGSLRLRLADALEQHGSVIVDLNAAEDVDLSILGVLLAAQRRARAVGGRLVIVVGGDADPLLTHLVDRSGLRAAMLIEPTRLLAEARLLAAATWI